MLTMNRCRTKNYYTLLHIFSNVEMQDSLDNKTCRTKMTQTKIRNGGPQQLPTQIRWQNNNTANIFKSTKYDSQNLYLSYQYYKTIILRFT